MKCRRSFVRTTMALLPEVGEGTRYLGSEDDDRRVDRRRGHRLTEPACDARLSAALGACGIESLIHFRARRPSPAARADWRPLESGQVGGVGFGAQTAHDAIEFRGR